MCLRQLADFDERYDDFVAAGRGVVFVSTDTPEVAQRLQEQMKLRLTLACDPERAAVQAWSLFNSREHGGIAKPALFALDAHGTIELRNLGGILQRATADSTLQALAGRGEVHTRAMVPRPGDVGNAVSNKLHD